MKSICLFILTVIVAFSASGEDSQATREDLVCFLDAGKDTCQVLRSFAFMCSYYKEWNREYTIAFSDREKLFKTPEEEQALKKQQLELAEGAISRMAIDVEELLILEHYFGLLKCIVESNKPTYYKELLENEYKNMYYFYNNKEYLEKTHQLEIINDINDSNQYLMEIIQNDLSAIGEILNTFVDKIEDDLKVLNDNIKYKCHSIIMEEYYIHSSDESNVNTQHIDVDVRVKYLHLQGIYAIYIERISLIKTIPSLLHSVWKKILSGEPFNDELNLLRLDLDEIQNSINRLYSY